VANREVVDEKELKKQPWEVISTTKTYVIASETK
jgi:hypothetical protein